MINIITYFNNCVIRKILSLLQNKLIYYLEAENFPNNNYPAELDIGQQQKMLEDFRDEANSFKPYPGNVCPYLLAILSTMAKKNKLKILDFGARNIDLYVNLNFNLDNLDYYYFDLPQNNATIEELRKTNSLDNLTILNTMEEVKKSKVDFIYLGGLLQYIDDYKDLLENLFLTCADYLFIAAALCYQNNKTENEKFVFQQLNSLPQINYGYMFQYKSLIKFLNENGWDLIFQAENRTDKFINFNKLTDKYGEIEYVDLLFRSRSRQEKI
jgi:putative methyltransferase (TIGR04325 family)